MKINAVTIIIISHHQLMCNVINKSVFFFINLSILGHELKKNINQQLFKLSGVDHCVTSAYHPHETGLVEKTKVQQLMSSKA